MGLVATQRVADRFIRKSSLGTTSRPFPLNEHFWTRFSSTRERKVDSAIVCLGVFFLFRALAFACLYPLLPLRLPQRLRLNWERLLFFGSDWIDFEKRKVSLSIKLLEELQNKEAVSKFSSPLSGKNLPFSSLSEDLDKKEKKTDED